MGPAIPPQPGSDAGIANTVSTAELTPETVGRFRTRREVTNILAIGAADRTLSTLGTLQAHLRLEHGVATTTAKKAAQRAGQEPRKDLQEHMKHVLDMAYGECYVTEAGDQRWRCHYCE